MAGSVWFYEMSATASGADEDAGNVLAGQMASLGEQLGLACAAANEVALWREVRSRSEPEPEHEMCMRAMAEAQSLFVIGAGHAFANVAVRALVLHQATKTELIQRFARKGLSPTLEPFSQSRLDWVSMNERTCGKIERAAQASGVREAICLIEPVVAFGKGSHWRRLIDRRGKDFHRWRPQSHGVQGVSQRSLWAGDGRVRRLSLGHRPYVDAEGLAEEIAEMATETMMELSAAMETFMERWPAAYEHLAPNSRSAQGHIQTVQ